MSTTEHTINDALAECLRGTRYIWRTRNILRSENTAILKNHAKQPDILVIEPNVSPVVIETEVVPATTVELDACSRLGEKLEVTGRRILSAIAVRLPVRLRSQEGTSLSDELKRANDFQIAMFTGTSPTASVRWPKSGWLRGNIIDLSILSQSATIPPEVINDTAEKLISEVSDISGLLGEIIESKPGIAKKISEELHQEDSLQTRRMAATILTNAFVFHETLANGPDELSSINSLAQLRDSTGNITKYVILAEWRKILNVNYWPIFDIARRIFETIPPSESGNLIERLLHTTEKLLNSQMMRSHDLTGAVFQSLIADRKFLAAYYTTPASAALLSDLAITSNFLFTRDFWGDPDNVTSMRIADFACGTGTLLSTIYHRISQFHEIAGGDASVLHREMMATVLVGCDILPAATHLTASMLAGAYPATKYDRSLILTLAYGKRPNGGIALGSIDLLDPQKILEIFSITAKASEGMGEKERETWESLPHSSFDIVIMNPPFTRATGHEGRKIGVPNPMFAAFGSSAEDQRIMSEVTSRLTTETCAHGNAGEASIFLALADTKLKPNGSLALVMPLSLMSGDAWEKSRSLLAKKYSDLILVSIAGKDDESLSFSADTDMGECLIIGLKTEKEEKRAVFVVLKERPSNSLIGANAAREIRSLVNKGRIRRLEDGPYGGTSLKFGNETIGQIIDAPLPLSGGWNLNRTLDISLAQTAYQLTNEHRVWLPSMNRAEAKAINITTVQNIGEIGPYHADINGLTSNGGIRGPFTVIPIEQQSIPSYPILWSHIARVQRTLSFEADTQGQPRCGSTDYEQDIINSKVENIWRTASHCHFNRDFRFNSQSTAMQLTKRSTIGGRAWLSIRLASLEQEKALVLWANSSLGLLLYWWHANKQQSGRGSIGKTSLQTLSVLDVTKLEQTELDKAVDLFDSVSQKELLPLHEMNNDPIRAEIDTCFALDILGLPSLLASPDGPLGLLRSKLSKEPSIRGQK